MVTGSARPLSYDLPHCFADLERRMFFAVKACGTEMCQKLTTWDLEAIVIWNELDVSVKDNYICCHPALCLWRMDSIMLRFK